MMAHSETHAKLMSHKERRQSKLRLLQRQKRSKKLFELRNKIYKAKTGKSLSEEKEVKAANDVSKPASTVRI